MTGENPENFTNLVDCFWGSVYSVISNKNWVVYAKQPFGGALQVINYLSRYTNAIYLIFYSL